MSDFPSSPPLLLLPYLFQVYFYYFLFIFSSRASSAPVPTRPSSCQACTTTPAVPWGASLCSSPPPSAFRVSRAACYFSHVETKTFLSPMHRSRSRCSRRPGFSPAAPSMPYAFPTPEMQQYASLMAMQQQQQQQQQQASPGAMRQYYSLSTPQLIVCENQRCPLRFYPPQYYMQGGGPVSTVRPVPPPPLPFLSAGSFVRSRLYCARDVTRARRLRQDLKIRRQCT